MTAADAFEPPKYLASLIAAVNDGAKAAQGGAFLFLLVGLYLLATAFSATDEDLLLGKTVTILQIGATLPVTFSFAIAPGVFVFLHIYTLVRYALLADNVRQFRFELDKTVLGQNNRERCLHLLANVEFIVALSAPLGSRLHSRFWPWLFGSILAIFPVITLLLVQINTVRYQSDLITWVQRIWLVLDLIALALFFARTPVNTRFRLHPKLLVIVPVILLALDVCWISPVPAAADARLVRYDRNDVYWINHPKPSLAALARYPLDLLLCPNLNWGCRFLRVEHRTLVEKVWDDKAIVAMRAGNADQIQSLASIEGVVLRDRSFRFAALDESRLFAADLSRSDLRGASLQGASLPGARLTATRLEGANLNYAQLQSANLSFARLTTATLVGARLRGAELGLAQMRNSNMSTAELQGADMTGAQLSCARLVYAQMEGVDLTGVSAFGADLVGAQLQGAYVRYAGARLDGASLTAAQFQGADLRGSSFWRATSQYDTNFALADLRGAAISAPPADLGANLADLRRAVLDTPPESLPAGSDSTCRPATLEPNPNESPPPFLFAASTSQPILAGDRPDAILKAHPDWLVTTPTPAYIQALSDYLVGELAPSDPAIVLGIARRMGPSLPEIEETRPIAHPIACRLLATAALKLTQSSTDALASALKKENVTCPAAPTVPNNLAITPEFDFHQNPTPLHDTLPPSIGPQP